MPFKSFTNRKKKMYQSNEQVEITKITMADSTEGVVPWRKKEDKKIVGADEMLAELSRFLPAFQPAVDSGHPATSTIGNREVEEITYELCNIADELDSAWHLLQITIKNLDTGESRILKLFRLDINRTRKLDFPSREWEEVVLFDVWSSQRLCLFVKTTRPIGNHSLVVG